MNDFILFVGPMFGGKTTKLLSAIDRYRYQGRKILTFKPKIDERYSKEEIVTHWNARVPAKRVSSGEEIKTEVQSVIYHQPREKLSDVIIAVDEAFMIPGISQALIDLFGAGHTILVSSLQICSDSSVYDEIKNMMPWATKIEICPAVCSECGRDAFYTKKIGGSQTHTVEVGGADMYQPVCFKHFKEFLDNIEDSTNNLKGEY